MQRLLPCHTHVGDIRDIEIRTRRTVHLGLLALAVPLDEWVIGVKKDIAPTVEDDCLGTRDQRQACHLRFEDVIEAVAIGCDDIGQGIGELLRGLLMANTHRLDGRVIDQWMQNALNSIMSEGTDIITIGFVALHVGIGVGHKPVYYR